MAAEHTVRTEGLQILTFWENVVRLFTTDKGTTLDKRRLDYLSSATRFEDDFNPRRYFSLTRPQGDKRTTFLVIAEDNEAVIKIVKKCRSVALRHLPRTHRIDVSWLFEVCASPEIKLLHVGTKSQVADVLTKAFTNVETWHHLLRIAQIVEGPTTPPTTTTTAAASRSDVELSITTARHQSADGGIGSAGCQTVSSSLMRHGVAPTFFLDGNVQHSANSRLLPSPSSSNYDECRACGLLSQGHCLC